MQSLRAPGSVSVIYGWDNHLRSKMLYNRLIMLLIDNYVNDGGPGVV